MDLVTLAYPNQFVSLLLGFFKVVILVEALYVAQLTREMKQFVIKQHEIKFVKQEVKQLQPNLQDLFVE